MPDGKDGKKDDLFSEDLIDIYKALDANAKVEQAVNEVRAQKQAQKKQPSAFEQAASKGIKVGRAALGAAAGHALSRLATGEMKPGVAGKIANIAAGGLSGAAGTPQLADFFITSLFMNNPKTIEKLAAKGPAARYGATAGWLLGGLLAGKLGGAAASMLTKENYDPNILLDAPAVAVALGVPAAAEVFRASAAKKGAATQLLDKLDELRQTSRPKDEFGIPKSVVSEFYPGKLADKPQPYREAAEKLLRDFSAQQQQELEAVGKAVPGAVKSLAGEERSLVSDVVRGLRDTRSALAGIAAELKNEILGHSAQMKGLADEVALQETLPRQFTVREALLTIAKERALAKARDRVTRISERMARIDPDIDASERPEVLKHIMNEEKKIAEELGELESLEAQLRAEGDLNKIVENQELKRKVSSLKTAQYSTKQLLNSIAVQIPAIRNLESYVREQALLGRYDKAVKAIKEFSFSGASKDLEELLRKQGIMDKLDELHRTSEERLNEAARLNDIVKRYSMNDDSLASAIREASLLEGGDVLEVLWRKRMASRGAFGPEEDPPKMIAALNSAFRASGLGPKRHREYAETVTKAFFADLFTHASTGSTLKTPMNMANVLRKLDTTGGLKTLAEIVRLNNPGLGSVAVNNRAKKLHELLTTIGEIAQGNYVKKGLFSGSTWLLLQIVTRATSSPVLGAAAAGTQRALDVAVNGNEMLVKLIQNSDSLEEAVRLFKQGGASPSRRAFAWTKLMYLLKSIGVSLYEVESETDEPPAGTPIGLERDTIDSVYDAVDSIKEQLQQQAPQQQQQAPPGGQMF